MAATMTTQPTTLPGVAAWNELRRGYKLDVPEYYNFAVDCIGGFAADPTHVAIQHLALDGSEQTITFADLAERSDRIASALRERGIEPGDRVLLLLPRIPEWFEVLLGAMKLGAIVVPCTIMLTASDLEYRLQVSGAKCIITIDEVAERVDAVVAPARPSVFRSSSAGSAPAGSATRRASGAPAEFEPVRTRRDDPCMIYFTSGTTAHPKMILQSHTFRSALPCPRCLAGPARGRDSWRLSDTGWLTAIFGLFGGWSIGALLFVQDARGRFDPPQTIDLLERYPIGSFFPPPTIYRMLIFQDLAGLTPLRSRSARVPVSR